MGRDGRYLRTTETLLDLTFHDFVMVQILYLLAAILINVRTINGSRNNVKAENEAVVTTSGINLNTDQIQIKQIFLHINKTLYVIYVP